MRDSEQLQSLRTESTEFLSVRDREKMARPRKSRTHGRIILYTVMFALILSVSARAQRGMPERAGGPRGPRRGQAEVRARQPMKWQEQLGVLFNLTQERHRLEKRKEQLLNRLFDSKKRFEEERRPLRRFFLRKEINQTEADLHLAIEASMAKQQEQRQVIRQFVNNRNQIEEAIARRSEEIEKQTAALRQDPDANSQQLLRLQREQTRLSRFRELLTIMEADPERLVESPPTELPEPLTPPTDYPHGAMPLRLQERLERLERQLHFLQKRIDDIQREMQEMNDELAPYLPREEMPAEPPPSPPPSEPITTTP